MKPFALTLVCALMLGHVSAPVAAQDLPDPLEAMDRSFALWSQDDKTAYFSYMSEVIRRARQEDALAPEWAFLFASFSDFVRNEQKNPAYALRLADEALAFLAPHGTDAADLVALARTSRAFALADLGRYAEAVAEVQVSEPLFRTKMGDEMANSMLADAAEWAKGLPSAANYSAFDLARSTLDQASAALDRGDYGAALTLAARAMLPEGTGLDSAEVARINAVAGGIGGHALYRLNRHAEALAMLRRAAGLVAGKGWEDQSPPKLAIDPAGDAARLSSLFFWLARTGLEADALWLVLPALNIAESLDFDGGTRLPILYVRANFHIALSEPKRAEAVFAEAVAVGKTQGKPKDALLAEYYLAVHRFLYADVPGNDLTQTLIDLTHRVVAEADDLVDPAHVQAETAQALMETGRDAEALAFSRAALALRLKRASDSADTALGQDGQRKTTRKLVEFLLRSAHATDSGSPEAICPDDPARGCAVFYRP